MQSAAWRREEYQCVDCHPRARPSLIPIMFGSRAPCRLRRGHDSWISAYQKWSATRAQARSHARAPWDNKRLCQVEPPPSPTPPSPQSFPTSQSHFVNQIAASASEWPPQLEAATSGSSSPRSTLNKRRQHDWLSEWWGRKRSNWLSQYHCGRSGPSPRPPLTLKSGFGLCLLVRSPNMLTADCVWVATPAWTQRFKSAGSLLKGIANHFKDLSRSRIRDGFKPPLK